MRKMLLLAGDSADGSGCTLDGASRRFRNLVRPEADVINEFR